MLSSLLCNIIVKCSHFSVTLCHKRRQRVRAEDLIKIGSKESDLRKLFRMKRTALLALGHFLIRVAGLNPNRGEDPIYANLVHPTACSSCLRVTKAHPSR